MERRTGFRQQSLIPLLDRYNRVGELYNEFVYDHAEDRAIIRTSQDMEPIFERNKALQNEGDGFSPSREWWWVASIPNIIIHKWMVEEGIDIWTTEGWERAKKKLNDPEYAYLRTHTGRF